MAIDADTIVTLPDIEVMYVAGQKGAPIPEQAQAAFQELEAKLPTLKRRRFYGCLIDDEYRACVAIDARDDVGSLPHPRWTIPGGRYARRRIVDWEQHRHMIGPTFESLRAGNRIDPARPLIEFYRSRQDLLAMVPVL
jgi:hypothetical protein